MATTTSTRVEMDVNVEGLDMIENVCIYYFHDRGFALLSPRYGY